MSKTFRSFLIVFAAFVQILHLFNNSNAQDLEVSIKLDASNPEIVTIEGKRKFAAKQTSRNLSFLTSIAGQEVSGNRITNLNLFNSKGTPVSYKKFMQGEYVAESEFVGWSYQVDLTPPKEWKLMAHVSWMMKTGGIAVLDDLLPQFDENEKIRSAKVVFSLPPDNGPSIWEVRTSDASRQEDVFSVKNLAKTVFFISEGVKPLSLLYPRGSGKPPNPWTIDAYFFGDFSFSQHQVLDLAWPIYEDYQKHFGEEWLSAKIALIKLPSKIPPDTWEAETRGRNITILTSDSTFKSQTLQQLHEQLRHEMFHLWIPNGVNLTGNYDWFYEGFALYQSLRTGVALNRIRFDDYLDTLSRAYEIDRQQRSKLSLIELSKNRWSGDNNTVIYARGMLVAFLCDLAMLEKSKGKRSVTDLLRKLYESHRPPNPETDGNIAVLALLRSYAELTPIIDRNITGAESIEWNDLLKGAGLEGDASEKTTNLKVTAKPSGRQKDLLDKLGYNNWRKLTLK